jgi:hypothetical protein
MTREEYELQLDTYIREQMATVPAGRKKLTFWAEFNRNMKENFDAQLAANGIVVE